MIHSVVIGEKPPSKRPRKQSRCVGAHAMCLGVLPGVYVYMNVSIQEHIRIYWDTHTNEYKLQHDFVDSMDFVCSRSQQVMFQSL